MKTGCKVILTSLIFLLISSPIFAAAQKKEATRIGIPTGSAEGAAYGWILGLSAIVNREVPEVQVTVEVSPGTAVNLEYMRTKNAMIALTTTGGLYEAMNGLDRYEGKPRLAGVSEFIDLYAQGTLILTPKGKPLKSLADFKGKRVFIGQAGSPTPDWGKRWLKGLGLLDDTKVVIASWADAAKALTTGDIDIMATMYASYPMVAYVQEFRNFPVDWYSLSKEELEQSLRIFPWAVPFTIKPKPIVYPGVDYDVNTFAASMGLVAQDDLDENIAYKMISAIMRHPDEVKVINPNLAYLLELENQVTVGKLVPLHKGMKKYLKEKGMLK